MTRRYRILLLGLAAVGLLVPGYLLAQTNTPQNRIRSRGANNTFVQNRLMQNRSFATVAQGAGAQVTLTGRIIDVNTFFTSSSFQPGQPAIIGEPVSAGAQATGQFSTSGQQGVRGIPSQTGTGTVGSPPNAIIGANQGPTPQSVGNTTGTVNTMANPPAIGGTRQTNPNLNQNAGAANLSGGNPNATVGNPNVHTPIQGSPQGPIAQGANAPQPNQVATGTGPVFVLATQTGPVLVSQQLMPGSALVLQPTSTEVQITGLLFERAGLRYLLVNPEMLSGTPNITGAPQGVGTTGTVGQSGTTTIGQPPGTNFGQSGTTAVGQPPGTNFGQSGTTNTDTTGGGAGPGR